MKFIFFILFARMVDSDLHHSVAISGLFKDTNFLDEELLTELSKRYNHTLEIELTSVKFSVISKRTPCAIFDHYDFKLPDFEFYAIGEYDLLKSVLCNFQNDVVSFNLQYYFSYYSGGLFVSKNCRTKKAVWSENIKNDMIFNTYTPSRETNQFLKLTKENMFKYIRNLRMYTKLNPITKKIDLYSDYINCGTYEESFNEVLNVVDKDFNFSSRKYLEYIKDDYNNKFKDNGTDFHRLLDFIDLVGEIEDLCKISFLKQASSEDPQEDVSISKIFCISLSDHILHLKKTCKFFDSKWKEIIDKNILFTVVQDKICISFDEVKKHCVVYVKIFVGDRVTSLIHLEETLYSAVL
ncbi:hypothetical protein NGRA_2658 [Nosema granulosis]|uniref:Uncharacterized protein n=1 Tax=Nosema granulosis TaxID=83296 RepID=A0A9P6GW75_9MICR|nr:hypothetical protein NGRA_2658 [Nosema granulosis]